ncbi:hypothetical protein [Diaminobutyricibacter sp. McL0608]|uniref:hypothetical protein n=1 Tax=Leifsonia sp. McL0608 TaxID=3143537 RepID=UPI0031F2FD8C
MAADPETGGRAGATDRILRYTKWVALIIIPFLVVAWVLLYLLPGDTEQLFAWTIMPPLTAMFLASAYLGGIVFFINVLRPNTWHRVRHGFPAVLVFATLLSIATFLHWDRFHPGHISFIVWVTLYVVTPFLVLAVLILNRGQDPGVPDERDYALPLVVRVVLAVIGLCALVAGLFLFFSPQQTIAVWAWLLTPLTARVAGAVLTLPGVVNVWMLWDARWSAFRWVFQAQLASLVFIVAALGLRRDDLLWERPSAALFVGGMIFSLVAYAGFYIWCDARARALAPRAAPL